MASLRAPGAVERGKVASPLGTVSLSGEVLEPCDLTTKRQPPELALGLLVGRMISKARAVGLRGRDRRGGNGRLTARPQIAVAITVAALPRSALAPLDRHPLPSWRRSARARKLSDLQMAFRKSH